MDLPGHGLSSGKPASIGSFEEYSEALESVLELAAKLPRPWVGIAQSTGCAVIMDSLLHRKLDERFGLAHYVLLCPLLYPVGWSLSRYVFYLTRSFLPGIRRSFARNSHDDSFFAFSGSMTVCRPGHCPLPGSQRWPITSSALPEQLSPGCRFRLFRGRTTERLTGGRICH